METLEEAVKRLIKENYGSIRCFAEKIGAPASSVYSCLDRGLANTRAELTDKIYRELNIDWDTASFTDFDVLRTKTEREVKAQTIEDGNVRRLLHSYSQLNSEGQRIVIEFIDTLICSCKYESEIKK